MFNDYNDLVNVEDLCEMLSIGKNAAYKLLASGDLKCFRLKRIWKIPKQCVINYILNQSEYIKNKD
ncbi:Helix-turn-helix domain-containing protein [Propionispira arboris]|uniref:Helix-turn-helix domain-containing protein n=1 Tax=Propionispira arboris TaxID=84035 RepID=A0A1H7D3K6_9FIRM|nr:helix-turn-helix domain-containing protein [Propionispira arboris]SEJ95924.1 Helix-turn-helix domain-containing protein [Propionispira arboris]